MTDGEKIIWAAAFVAAFNEYAARGLGADAATWHRHPSFVDRATRLAAERATLTVEALRGIKTKDVETLCNEGEMLCAMLECDPINNS